MQGVITCSSYKHPRFGRLATLQAYEHGERILLSETSEGDAEKGGNSISVSVLLAIAIDC